MLTQEYNKHVKESPVLNPRAKGAKGRQILPKSLGNPNYSLMIMKKCKNTFTTEPGSEQTSQSRIEDTDGTGQVCVPKLTSDLILQ